MTHRHRVAAEWEPVSHAVLAWPLIVPPNLLRIIQESCQLLIIVPGREALEHCQALLKEERIEANLVSCDTGLAWGWARDWGPASVFTASGEMCLLNHRFVGYPVAGPGKGSPLIDDPFGSDPYLSDDMVSSRIASELGLNVIDTGHTLTGGNFLVDGHGTAFTTQLLLDEDASLGWTRSDLELDIKDLLSVTRLHVLDNFEELGIQHVNCVLKPLSPDRILISKPPPDHYSARFVDAILNYVSTIDTPSGRNYKVESIDSPRFRSEQLAAYVNALVLNDLILVPTYGIPEDERAIDRWRQLMPGYTVHGFNNDIEVPHVGYTGWQSYDGIHSRVATIADSKMLFMSHSGPSQARRGSDPLMLNVEVVDYSGAGLELERLEAWYQVSGDGPWKSIRLAPTREQHVFIAAIRDAKPNSPINYYFSAADRSGRSATYPSSAPDQYLTFNLD